MAKTNRKPEGYAETFLGAAGGPSRPQKEEEVGNKAIYVTVRFTEADVAKMDARAQKMGRMSRSQLVRLAVMDYLEK